MLSVSILAGGVAATTVLCIGYVVYNIFLHPLRNFPGPLLCRASPLYRHYKFLRGELLFETERLHKQYGPVVRIRPNELSFIDPEAWRDIYVAHGGSARLGDFARYDRFYQWAGPSAPETFVSLDRPYHDSMKRQLSPAFSERSLQFQEPIIQGYTDTLIRKLTEASKDGKPVNLREWFNHYTFDIIGNLGFGSDFGGLESEQYHPWVKAVSQNVREFAIMQVLMYLGLQRIVHVLSGSSLLRGKILHEHLTREKVEARIKVEKPRLDIFQPLLDRKPPLKLSEEVRSTFKNEEDITIVSVNQLPYLAACLNEALRCFPAVPPALPRVVPHGGAVIAGHAVPENTVVAVASWATNHSERHFNKALEYHPERFMKDPEFSEDRFDTFQPFGLGHGNCPGRK
ncbi:hypothetical protein J7337_007832 [Fusarium musae]|uniref:Cytochrome P450 monooxygenase n=1 Tax=Fusarium musae TaxID=1042133 RepID=A0A9P8IP55_9HYPO|nr:hypothetical protein J7337_007832 [Fusarium musae]KAG9502116.1 hypothetical protein J7337_007832 [Fusarium musae]